MCPRMTCTFDREPCTDDQPTAAPEERTFGPVAKPSPLGVDRILEDSILSTDHVPPLRLSWGGPPHVRIDAQIGDHDETTVHVMNDGDTPRTLDTVTTVGSKAFSVHAPVSEIPAHASIPLTLRFEPHAVVEQGRLVVTPHRGRALVIELEGHGHASNVAAPTSHERPQPRREERKAPIPRAPGSWQLAIPPRIDLGEAVVGQRRRGGATILAIDRVQGPRIRAQLAGDRSLRLLRAPQFLVGTRGEVDDAAAFELEHHATQAGEVSAMLNIEILDQPAETFAVPVVAAAHAPGDPAWAEQRAQKQQAERDAAEDARAKRQHERALREGQQELRNIDNNQPRGYATLEQKRDGLVRMLDSHFRRRRQGAADAEKEVADYRKKPPPPPRPSLAEQLAWSALELATNMISGGLAKAAEPLVVKALTTSMPKLPTLQDPSELIVGEPSRTVVGALVEGLKHLIKKTGGAAGNALKSGSRAPTPDGVAGSRGAQIAFFSRQATLLSNAQDSQVGSLGEDLFNILLPYLRRDSDGAIAMMQAVTAAIEGTLEEAKQHQADESARAWVKYVEAASEPSTVADKLDPDHPLASVDGLIDVVVRADYRRPESAVERISTRFHGVSTLTMQRFSDWTLARLDLPVRVTSDFGSASTSLNVVRDPGGKVRFTEDTDGRSRWLARKGAAHGKGPDPIAGARALVEEEVFKDGGKPVTLADLNPEGDSVR